MTFATKILGLVAAFVLTAALAACGGGAVAVDSEGGEGAANPDAGAEGAEGGTEGIEGTEGAEGETEGAEGFEGVEGEEGGEGFEGVEGFEGAEGAETPDGGVQDAGIDAGVQDAGIDAGVQDGGIDAGVQDTWYDSASNLTWMINPASTTMNWNAAKSYCTGLGGGWRLPTIGELRSLIRGCAATQTGGSCGVTDSCLSYSSCRDSSCNGCSNGGGPDNGCYWPAPIEGTCAWYWSSSPVADDDYFAWSVGFNLGLVNYAHVDDGTIVRCVR